MTFCVRNKKSQIKVSNIVITLTNNKETGEYFDAGQVSSNHYFFIFNSLQSQINVIELYFCL